MDIIKYDDFAKLDLRVVNIKEASRVEGSDKLLQIKVKMGAEERQIIAGIGKSYEPDELVGRNIVIVANLEPRKLMGLESQGMLLAASEIDEEGSDKKVVLVTTMDEVASGSQVG